MKNLDQFSKRVLTVGVALMGVLLCASVFLYSAQKTFAVSNPVVQSIPYSVEQNTGVSEIQATVFDWDGYTSILSWNTYTGTTKLYHYDRQKGVWLASHHQMCDLAP